MSPSNATPRIRLPALPALLGLLLMTLASLPQHARAALDVPAMLYNNREQGKNTPLTLLPTKPLPVSLQTRLTSSGARVAPEFDTLSTPLQRALLWDAGLVLNSDGSKYVQLKTKCGKSMGDIFVSKDTVVRAANCSLAICNAQILAFAYPNCSADAVVPQTRCAVTERDPALAGVRVKPVSTLWSEEGVVEDAHDFRLFAYDTAPSAPLTTTKLYTLYQLPAFALSSESTCPNKATAFVVPCQSISDSTATTGGAGSSDAAASVTPGSWCVPQPGYLVGLWLADEVNAPVHAADHRKWVQVATVFIALFALACLVGVGFAYLAWSKRVDKSVSAGLGALGAGSGTSRASDAITAPHYAVLHGDDASSSRGDAVHVRDSSHGGTDASPRHGSTEQPSVSKMMLSAVEIERSNAAVLAQSAELAAFVGDSELLVCAIEYESLQFETLIARGANGEVWRGQYAGQFVAIKRLVADLRRDVRALELFAREIRLGAALEHPHIVRFVGLSWRALPELSMVSEFLPMGDLARFLQAPASRALTWAHEKRSLAADIAQALVYLHSLRPVIIHRDLKSLNVLLTAACEAKLSDFGLSRERSFDETMTMGVGTLLWTAPEVLRGDRYSEKADIYSFGVVMSELDTCLPPYALNDEVGGAGTGAGDGADGAGGGRRRQRAKSVELLPLIRRGKITPQFRADCPPAVLALAHACLHQDPERRPNAMQLVYMLQSKLSQSL